MRDVPRLGIWALNGRLCQNRTTIGLSGPRRCRGVSARIDYVPSRRSASPRMQPCVLQAGSRVLRTVKAFPQNPVHAPSPYFGRPRGVLTHPARGLDRPRRRPMPTVVTPSSLLQLTSWTQPAWTDEVSTDGDLIECSRTLGVVPGGRDALDTVT